MEIDITKPPNTADIELNYQRMWAAYMARAQRESEVNFWRGFEEGLKTHWRWRLWFWLRDRAG